MPTTATSKHWKLYIFAGKSIGVAFCSPAPANWLDAFLNCRQYYTKLCAISLCLFWCSATHFENNNMNIPIRTSENDVKQIIYEKTKNSVEHQFIVVIWFRRFGKRYIIFRICTIFGQCIPPSFSHMLFVPKTVMPLRFRSHESFSLCIGSLLHFTKFAYINSYTFWMSLPNWMFSHHQNREKLIIWLGNGVFSCQTKQTRISFIKKTNEMSFRGEYDVSFWWEMSRESFRSIQKTIMWINKGLANVSFVVITSPRGFRAI